MKLVTAAELYESKPVAVEWVAEPYIAMEAITELDGKAKSAGKTTFALAMCKAILSGNRFLGGKTKKSAIVYLTEESRTTFLRALRRAGIGKENDLHILFWSETLGLQGVNRTRPKWEDVVEQAVNEAKAYGAKLLVVDTFAQFAGLVGDKENIAGDVLAAMMPLQQARDLGIAILVIRHERKEGGAVGESGRGNSALTGSVDIVLRLKRPEGQGHSNRRLLEALSRFDETPRMLNIELANGEYQTVGENGQNASAIDASKVMAALPNTEDAAVPISAVVAKGISRASVQSILEGLIGSKQVETAGKGVKNDPFRYYKKLVPELADLGTTA